MAKPKKFLGRYLVHTLERTQKKGEILHSIVFFTTNKDMK